MGIRFRPQFFVITLVGFVAARGPLLLADEAPPAQPATKSGAGSASVPAAKDAPVSKNANRSVNSLKTWERDLFNPFGAVRPDPSLDEALHPPMPPAPQQPSQKQLEKYDRKKNWIFLDPNDTGMLSGSDDPLKEKEYGQDGKPKKKPGLVENFLRNSEHKPLRPGMNSSEGSSLDPVRDLDRSRFGNKGEGQSDSAASEGATDRETDLRKKLDESRLHDGTSHGTLSDIFGLGTKRARSDEDVRLGKQRMNEFREILGMPTAPTTLIETRRANGLDTFSTPSPNSSFVSPSALTPGRNDSWNNPFGNNIPSGATPHVGSVFENNAAKNAFGPSTSHQAPAKAPPVKYPITNPQNFSFPKRDF
jgi:hypothetical protein